MVRLQRGNQPFAVAFRRFATFLGQRDCRYARLLRSGKRIGVRTVADDQRNTAAVQHPALLRVQQGLQVCAPAAHQHGDVQHRVTPPSPRTTSPSA